MHVPSIGAANLSSIDPTSPGRAAMRSDRLGDPAVAVGAMKLAAAACCLLGQPAVAHTYL
jgi:hypothetical protein